jgi:hypothetical protein
LTVCTSLQVPTANGIAMQRARMLLPLAWLVRVNDTATHRAWLSTVFDGFMTRQHCVGEWCTFREELGAPGWAGTTRVPNNENYGTFEAPLNQENDDPVCDFLYTIPFALLGLHEAAGATGNATMRAAADRLANFVVRAQARSSELPALDGAFFRAFDFGKWEAWASDADLGWGAWSVESGWTQSWLTTLLGLRQLNVSLWELGQRLSPDIQSEFDAWTPVMFDPGPPPPSRDCLPATASGASLTFVVETSRSELCAPAPGAATSQVRYTGKACGGGGGAAGAPILWSGMETLDPRAGTSVCSWTAASEPAGWRDEWTGGCGVGPSRLPTLPDHLCPP